MSPTSLSPSSFGSGSRSPSAPLESKVQLLIIRHGKSANRGRAKGQAASLDPELSEVGFEQAEALGVRLEKELRRINTGDLIIASSPMRRCLLTVRPAIFKLRVPQRNCFTHGGCFEYGCAGLGNPGTPLDDIMTNFPEFTPVGFKADGSWDYQGSSQRENEEDAKPRARRIVDWIWDMAHSLSTRPSRRGKVMILSFHQTMSDLVTQLLVDGTDSLWVYGDMKYKLQNTGITTISLQGDRDARLEVQNDHGHLRGIKTPSNNVQDNQDEIPFGRTRTGKEKAQLRAKFSAIDKSGDFKLNFEEMAGLLRSGNPHMTEEQLWQLFTGTDESGDGEIDFDEFVEYVFGNE